MKTKKNLNYNLGTAAVEGLKPSKKAIKIFMQIDNNLISIDDAIKKIEMMYQLRKN